MESNDRTGKSEKKVETVEDAIVALKILTSKNDDHWKKFSLECEESKASSKKPDEKIKVLIDARRRSKNERNEKIKKLIDAQKMTENKLSELTDAVKAAHQRIDKIEE
jgi:hypothetical protein